VARYPSRDPAEIALFDSRESNQHAANDPINRLDRSGLASMVDYSQINTESPVAAERL